MFKNLKPIKLWGSWQAPNPFKVIIILEELGLPWEMIPVGPQTVKQRPFTDLNPNGRAPAIQDPNFCPDPHYSGRDQQPPLVLWESGAIVDYLVTTYSSPSPSPSPSSAIPTTGDTKTRENRIPARLLPAAAADQWRAKQLSFFQATGQGPYFGQWAWFERFHQPGAARIDSAVARYADEIVRVTGVLDEMLRGEAGVNGRREWLVGDHCTYADLVFIPYMQMVHVDFRDERVVGRLAPFVHYAAWRERLLRRPAVAKAVADRSRGIAEYNKQKEENNDNNEKKGEGLNTGEGN